MNDLIRITNNEQGSSVVASARELYDFLGFDPSQWSRWSKKNIINNPYGKEGEDWEGFDLVSSGNATKDFHLTVDFAKRLSMLARTDKGEEIRRYFLECERKAQQQLSPVLLSVEQVLLQQAHALVEQGNLLAQLRAEVESIKGSSGLIRPSVIPPHLKRTPSLTNPPKRPASDLRQAVKHRVNEYCGYHGAEQGETYNYLYKRLNEVWSINVYRLIRLSGESMLDAIERYGHLDKIHGLIMAELKYVEE
ncbi:hypothetical protein EXU85_20280 [Spirosoma sp. KCTC 42546]|uniref:antA/AntB antirepressor family protein n=1 Tax=Spirosoma sp. KCTC 42546 TaxID=2520506 RepID=UPI0011589603|nr:antA/AntB antirepressor family protein [Spirosoma sp. KCTC 42546]QDK80817.1 hypothetical protein EXU85_20280 [Spirosoma sp. KCTC 42546]